VQSMLLSKALKMQQDLEDKKHEVIIENLESKIAELNTKLLSQSESFQQEKQKLNAKFEAEVQKSSDLKKSLTSLQIKCLEFSNRCVQRLK
jgi:hypothetical protein